MKRLTIFCMIMSLFILIAGFCQTAMDPEIFTGQWYSSKDQSIYLFQEGLIYCPKHAIALSDTASISGAYAFSGKSVFLFVSNIQGLEREKELFFIQKGDGSFLCENSDGSGEIYFIRYRP